MGNNPSTLSSREAAAATSQDREIHETGFIQLRSTHDVSVADAHIQNMDQFVSDLQEAINAVTSTSNQGRYTEVHVLFLCWREDTLGVKREITDLSDVLSRMYRFETHHYEIRGEKPGRDTQTRVGQFLDEHDARDHLLILYYAGHAMPGRQGSEPPIWTESTQPGAPTMAAGGIQAVFEEADADALLLYDSCHSAHPAINSSGNGVTEVIAAAGFELQAPTVGRDSFTHALIQALTQACRGPPFSATKLHEMALRWLKCRTREHLRDQHGDIWTDPSGRPALQRTPTSTPVHCFLTEVRPHRGIMLAPLPIKPAVPSGSIHSTSFSNTSTPPSNSQPSSASHASSATDLSEDLMSSTTNILLSIRLENDYFQEDNMENLWTWREWLRNMPPEAKSVKVEAVYRSASTLVLMSVPIAFWDALPNNPAYSFVGFVTSSNKASRLQLVEQIEPALGKIKTIRLADQSIRAQGPHPRSSNSRDSGYGEDEEDQSFSGIFGKSYATEGKDENDRGSEGTVGASILPSLDAESRLPVPQPKTQNKRARFTSSLTSTIEEAEDSAVNLGDIDSTPPQSRTESIPQRIGLRQLKSKWTASGLLRATEIDTSQTTVSVRNPKATFLYDLEDIITSLRNLDELGYHLDSSSLPQRYSDILRRCTMLFKSHEINVQLLGSRQANSMSSTPRWSSLVASPLFHDKLSNSQEHMEAKYIREKMQRYVRIADLKISALRNRGMALSHSSPQKSHSQQNHMRSIRYV